MAEIMVFASGKGGVGKSTLTVGIAKVLCTLGKKVLIVDTDIGLRTLDLLAEGAENLVYDWGDVLLNRCTFSDAIVGTETLKLLSCPTQYEDAFSVDAFKELLLREQEAFDFIIIDAPAGLGRGFLLACHAAQRAFVIATPDPICVRSACKAAESIRDVGVEDCRLIINRFRKKAVQKKKLLNIDSMIDSTTVQLIGVVPEDGDIIFGCIGEQEQCSTPAFRRIAGRICGENIPLFQKI